jgi:AraC-like DNA-binding protein
MNDYPAVLLDPDRPYDRIRELYLYREPELLAAIRCGDRRGARKIINYLLVHIYSAGEERSELLKGLLLELVVMMARAAVEAGAAQADILGLHFKHLSELAEIQDEEDLSVWLKQAFERIFTVIERQEGGDSPPRIARALAYMRDGLDREITREEVARHAGLSPGHFSHLLRASTGRSFSESLRVFRIEAACSLLRGGDRTLADIADACGFCDQSYFTHVFRELKGMTPRQFRESRESADPGKSDHD